ncbi:hypothetical protein [uncultured Massilia sp.]|uniref:hypothetical protein n=1 Tax=uncultured Massilia sp. TaxID=169973 RepID=UPI0025902BDB|nr:hypothetical protein [uncultured Massilia sp.]
MVRQLLSRWVALRCREPEFQRFLRVPDEATAAHSVRAICGVRSRGDIDRDPAAEKRFHQFIRLPFMQFQQHPTNQTTQEQ